MYISYVKSSFSCKKADVLDSFKHILKNHRISFYYAKQNILCYIAPYLNNFVDYFWKATYLIIIVFVRNLIAFILERTAQKFEKRYFYVLSTSSSWNLN